MARPKGVFRFNVGLFGIPAKIVDGVVRIKVNVRTDQEDQRELAKLPKDSPILMVDCSGGAVGENEDPDDSALAREISEETVDCTITPKGEFREFRQPTPILPKGEKTRRRSGLEASRAPWRPQAFRRSA